MEPSAGESHNLGLFKFWLLISQLLGAISIALVSAWCGQYLGGLGWQESKIRFNYHPFLMVLGMIFCYGESLLVYRVLRDQRKKLLKSLHFGLHTVVFIFAIVSLKAVFDYHSKAATPIPHLYSFHSWLGLTAVVLFAFQYLCGFLAFFSPGGFKKIRSSKYLNLHVFFGLAIFVMVVAAALTGINEKLIFTEGWKYKNLSTSAVVGNVLGYCLVLFTLVIVYLVTNPHYRRKPLPEEVQLLNGEQPPVY